MLYIGGKKLRNRVKLSTKVKTCVPKLAVVRRFDCIASKEKSWQQKFIKIKSIFNNDANLKH